MDFLHEICSNNMTILIFGGSGRLGGAFTRNFTEHTLLLPTRLEVDITSTKSIEEYCKSTHPDIVINAVAYNNCDGAEGDDWATAMMLNGRVPELIAHSTALHKIPFIHISTDYVFSGTNETGYTEDDQPHPINNYGWSKFIGEEAVLRQNPSATIVRVSRLYGHAAESTNAKRSFVEIVQELASKNTTFSINHSERSAPTLVDDVALHIKKYLLPTPQAGIFHMSNSGGCTWYEWAREIVSILKLPVTVTPNDPKNLTRAALRPQHSILLSTKIPAMRSWQEALRAFLLK